MKTLRKMSMEREISKLVILFQLVQLENIACLYFKLFLETGIMSWPAAFAIFTLI